MWPSTLPTLDPYDTNPAQNVISYRYTQDLDCLNDLDRDVSGVRDVGDVCNVCSYPGAVGVVGGGGRSA